jgi:hypothetical protein
MTTFHAGTNDPVNPSHYKDAYPVEIITIAECMNFNRGNAVKYIARAGLKDPDHEVTDLRKAIWYLNREIVRLAKQKEHGQQPVQ